MAIIQKPEMPSEKEKGSVLSIVNFIQTHLRLCQYKRCDRCVLVPIHNLFAVHSNVMVVSRLSRKAIFTFLGSPFRCLTSYLSLQPSFFSSSQTNRSAFSWADSRISSP